MKDFNPDEFIAQTEQAQPEEGESFSPDQFLMDTEPRREEGSSVDSALQGAGQGLTLGYLSQLQALAEPVTDRIFNVVTGNDVEPSNWNSEDYLAARDSYIARDEKLKSDNPAAYTAGQVGGGVATALAMAPASAATVAARAKQAASIGALYGVLSNPGDTEGIINEMQLSPRLKNAVIGAITGFGAQVGMDKIAKLSKPLANKIKKSAERWAAKALGAERGTVKEIGEDGIEKVGRYALDNDLLEMKAMDQTRTMIDKNRSLQKKGGEMMGEVYDQIDEVGIKEFDPLEVASKVDEEIGGFYRSPINKGETNQLENTLESILMRGDDAISLSEAQALKKEVGKVAKWKNNLNITDKEEMARDTYRIISKAIDEATESGAKKIGSKGLVDKLKKGKELYSQSKSAEKLLTNKAARETGNKFIGLSDAGWGGAAVATLGPKGLAIVGAKKLFEKFGAQGTARVLDKAAKTIFKAPELAKISKNNPSAFQALVYRFAVASEGNSSRLSPSFADRKLKKGDIWTAKGLDRVTTGEDPVNINNPRNIKKLLMTPKGESLLKRASSLEPNSREMASVKKQIKQYLKRKRK